MLALTFCRRAPALTRSHPHIVARSRMSTSPTFLPHNFEVIVAQPQKADPALTQKKFIDGFEIQRQHPDFVDVVLEGVKVEDENVALRVLEWTSFEGHMQRFRTSPSYKTFSEVRAGAYVTPPHITHYNFTSPIPTAPIVEYLRITLKPGEPFPPFYTALSHAFRHVRAGKGCTGITIGQQVEDASEVLCLLGWERYEDHMVEFAKGQTFEDWKAELGALLKTYVKDKGVEMWHARTCAPGAGI